MPREGLRTRTSGAGKEAPAPVALSTRRVSGRKRKSEEADENSELKLSEPDRIKQKAKYEGMLEEFDLEVERKVKSLHSQADDSFLSIRNALQVELVKIPKNVRKMTVRDFKAKFGAIPQAESIISNKPMPGLLKTNAFSKMDGSKLDLSTINVSEFSSQARMDILAKLNSAFSQVQSFVE